MYPVSLTGPRVAWRELTVQDVETVRDIVAHPDVFRYLIDEEVPEPDALRELLRAYTKEREEPDRSEYQLAITVDGQIIGTGGLKLHGGPGRCGEIGYLLHPDHWGRGLATEAADLLLTFGFTEAKLHRIEATVSPDNRASQRVLTKIGMTREGLRRHDTYLRGQWRDSEMFAALETDPRPRRP